MGHHVETDRNHKKKANHQFCSDSKICKPQVTVILLVIYYHPNSYVLIDYKIKMAKSF